MWYPATITEAPETEPITLAEAKRQVRADFDDDDDALADLIAVARNHAEKYCGVYLASQTVEVKADGWCDFEHLPIGPVTSITSIGYVDANGDEQTLGDTVYELRGDAVVLKYGQTWPVIQLRSLITLTLVVGAAAAEPAIKHAILVRLADLYESRGSQDDSKWTTFDSLLSNHRYY